jgi:hypothetical protein
MCTSIKEQGIMKTSKSKPKRLKPPKPKKVSKTARGKKEQLEKLVQTNGKDYGSTTDKVRNLEKILETKTTNPYGTGNLQVFEEDLAEMNLTDLQAMAVRVGVFPSGGATVLKNKLVKAFKAEALGTSDSIVEVEPPDNLKPGGKGYKVITDYLNE